MCNKRLLSRINRSESAERNTLWLFVVIVSMSKHAKKIARALYGVECVSKTCSMPSLGQPITTTTKHKKSTTINTINFCGETKKNNGLEYIFIRYHREREAKRRMDGWRCIASQPTYNFILKPNWVMALRCNAIVSVLRQHTLHRPHFV